MVSCDLLETDMIISGIPVATACVKTDHLFVTLCLLLVFGVLKSTKTTNSILVKIDGFFLTMLHETKAATGQGKQQ